MRSRSIAGIAFAGLAAAGMGVAAVTATRGAARGPSGARSTPDARRDFTEAEIARTGAFRRALRPWWLGGVAAGGAVTVGLGLTPAGSRLVAAAGRPVGGSWWARTLLGGLALSTAGVAPGLPFRIGRERALRRWGLSTQTWRSWSSDQAKSWAVSEVLGAGALLTYFGSRRAAPEWWWAWLAAGSAGVVFGLSFAAPLVFEPLFNRFTPMPPGPLRDDLLALATRAGYPVREVLVADASRRTTALNAYVSGYGASRRIVVFDTLLRDAPAGEVRTVAAHELGHAVRRDVLAGTLLGALGAAASVCALAAAGDRPPARRAAARAGVDGLDDPRSIALLGAVGAVAGFLASPAGAFLSRRIESRADAYALALTRDPAAFVAMERRLALTNLADLYPNRLLYLWFASHPSTALRIARARDFAAREGLPPVPAATDVVVP